MRFNISDVGHWRSDATYASTTDPEAQLYKKGPGKEAKLSFMGHDRNRHDDFGRRIRSGNS